MKKISTGMKKHFGKKGTTITLKYTDFENKAHSKNFETQEEAIEFKKILMAQGLAKTISLPFKMDNEEYAKGKTLKGKKKWIKPALSGKKGIVSKFAEKKGIIKAGKDLTLTSIRKVEKVATGKMKKRAIMAETLIGFNKKRFGEEGMNVEYAKGSTVTTNEGVIESFLSDKKELKVGNLSTHYSTMGDVVLLRNYGTLIAKRKGKTVSISTKKYSVTTTKIQNMIERMANGMGLKVEKIGEDEFAKGGEMYGYGGEVEGTYGRSKNPATIFVYKQGRRNWYVAEGSVNVNCTYDDIEDGVDIEELNDVDTFTASKPINSVEDLEMFMDDEEYAKGGGLKSIPKGNKGLPKLPESVRNKMGYMENGGYIELMGEGFDDGINKLTTAWFDWVNAPMTTKEDIELAKSDVLEYIEGMLDEKYRTGGVAGSKHVSVTKGYRLPHGYKAVKGSDKSYNYSKGHKGVKVDAGYRLPKGYEVVEGAYDMKYEHGTTLGDCWSCKLDKDEKEFACSVYNRMITCHPFCTEETLKNCDKKYLLSAIEKNMNAFSNDGKKLATSIVRKLK